jgi:hypothetical protein
MPAAELQNATECRGALQLLRPLATAFCSPIKIKLDFAHF